MYWQGCSSLEVKTRIGFLAYSVRLTETSTITFITFLFHERINLFQFISKILKIHLFASNSASTLLWFSWTREVRLLQTPDNNGIPPFLFSQRKAFRFSLIIFVIEAPLLPKLRGYFAEFLRESCLTPLVILYLPTYVGRINPDLVFSISNYQLQYYQGSSMMWTQDIGLQLYRPMGIDIKRSWPNL